MTRTKMPKARTSQGYEIMVKNEDDGSVAVIHVTLSPYEDGRLGEVWIDFGSLGASMSTAMSVWAKTLSIALQHGAHPHHLASCFSETREFRGRDLDSGEEVLSLYDAVAKLIRSETDTEGRLV